MTYPEDLTPDEIIDLRMFAFELYFILGIPLTVSVPTTSGDFVVSAPRDSENHLK